MNLEAPPFSPHLAASPPTLFPKQSKTVEQALHTTGPGIPRNYHLPADQKVLIRITSGGRIQTVYEDYSLTTLLTYSSRARKDLAQRSKKTWDGATLQWIIHIGNNANLEIGGMIVLLEFWRSLNPKGFPPNYLDLPRATRIEMPSHLISPLSQIELLYLHDAYLVLQPAYPLDNRKPRNHILEILSHPGMLNLHALPLLWKLYHSVDDTLTSRSCLSLVNGLGVEWLEDWSLMDAYRGISGLHAKLTQLRNERLDHLYGVRKVEGRARMLKGVTNEAKSVKNPRGGKKTRTKGKGKNGIVERELRGIAVYDRCGELQDGWDERGNEV